MIERITALLLLIALNGAATAQRGTAGAVDLALVLAVDASGSVDRVRFELQKQGYVAAFRHPRVFRVFAVPMPCDLHRSRCFRRKTAIAAKEVRL